MVGIQDYVQSGVLGPSHDLVNAAQPLLVQGIVGRLADMAHPRNGDADAGEALLLEAGERGLRGLFPLPGRLRRHTVGIGVKVVAHVPAKAQFQGTGHGRIVRQGGIVDHFLGCLRHFQGDIGRTGSLHNYISTTGLVTVVGGHLEREGDLVVLVGAVGFGNPGRQRKRRTGGGRDGKVIGTARLRRAQAGGTQGDSRGCLRGGRNGRFGGFAAAAKQRHSKGQERDTFSHHVNYLREGIDSRVKTWDDVISCFQ